MLLAILVFGIFLAIQRERAQTQMHASRALLSLECKLHYSPVMSLLPFTVDRSDTVAFHFANRLTGVTLYDIGAIDSAMVQLKRLKSIDTITLQVGGSCGLSWASGYEAKARIEKELLGVTVRVTGFSSRVVG